MSRARILALWLLRHVGPVENREAIIGDLLERLTEGKSTAWFWREVFGALAAGMRLPWTEIGLALLGPALPILLGRPLLPLALWRLPNPFVDGLMGSGLSWPLSAVIECVLRVVALTLLLTIEVIAVFAFQRMLNWMNVRRAVFISFPMMAVSLFLFVELDEMFPRSIENVLAQMPFCFAMLAGLLWAPRKAA